MRLLLADDHHLVREALCYYLCQNSEVDVIEASCLDEALDKAADGEFTAILLDLRMPGMNGLEGLERARTRFPGTPIIILSGSITREEAGEATRRGAAGVISKDLNGRALLTALQLILAGEIYISSSLLGGQAATREVSRATERQARQTLGNLTRRELEVVKLLAQGIGSSDMARELEVAEVTVRLHLHHALRKMGARNRADAVRIAVTNGIA
jgi:two-component system nitrate/nitrite response regulator NarL